MALDEVPTPSLVIDLARMERNIARFHERIASLGKPLRSHIKTHKVPAIAEQQLAAGSCGIAAAKPSEAAPFHAAGIDDIVIAFPSVGRDKWEHIATFARDARVTCNVDSVLEAEGLSDAARRHGVSIAVQIEVDTGFERVGIPAADIDDVADFARVIRGLPGLTLSGITTFRGKLGPRLQAMTNEEAGIDEGEQLVAVADALRARGLPIDAVTAGGTVTAPGAAHVEGITEVRAGTYVFHDAMMVAAGVARPDDVAATVLTTVVSTRRPGWATIDGGTKTFSGDRGMVGGATSDGAVAEAVDLDAAVTRTTEEHGMVRLGAGVSVEVGDRLRFVPYHVCTTVNLSNELVAVRDGVVEHVWPVAARGCRT